MSEKKLSIIEAADRLGVHPQTVRKYIAHGRLRGYRIAGQKLIRVSADDVDALMSPIPTAGTAA